MGSVTCFYLFDINVVQYAELINQSKTIIPHMYSMCGRLKSNQQLSDLTPKGKLSTTLSWVESKGSSLAVVFFNVNFEYKLRGECRSAVFKRRDLFKLIILKLKVHINKNSSQNNCQASRDRNFHAVQEVERAECRKDQRNVIKFYRNTSSDQ